VPSDAASEEPAAPSEALVQAGGQAEASQRVEANKQAEANQQAEADKQVAAAKQAEVDKETAKKLAEEAATLEAMRADALARAQAPKPVQPSRLPPMPTPLPQARQPLPAVDIAEWTFVEPAAETRRERAKAPAKASDPFAGGQARPVEEAPATPAVKRAATRGRSATKTATAKAVTASAPQAETTDEVAAKPARKTASKTASKTTSRTRQPRKTAASES